MSYTEIIPVKSLQDKVMHFWHLDLPPKGTTHPCEVLPDGSIDLVFEFSMKENSSYLFGTSTKVYNFKTKMDSGYLGIRFHPGVIPLLEDYSPSDIIDSHLKLPLCNKSLLHISKNVTDLPFIELKYCLENIVNNLEFKPKTTLIQNLSNFSAETFLQEGVLKLLNSLGLSRRQLERNFKKDFGVSIYKFQRIIRFQYAINLLKDSNLSITDIALASGYFDHSHMVNEFKKISSHTPKIFSS